MRKVLYTLTRGGAKPQYRHTPAWKGKRSYVLKGKKERKPKLTAVPKAKDLLFYITKRRQGLVLNIKVSRGDAGPRLYMLHGHI